MIDTQDIGRVTRCSTLGFVGAVRLPEPDVPAFGTFCLAEAQQGQSQVIGLIYDLSIEDDEFARQIAATDDVPQEIIADGRAHRQVPVEFSALAVGYHNEIGYFQSLPPQPPLTLAPIRRMAPEDLRAFSQRLDFLPLVLAASQVPSETLLVAALQTMARSRPESERRGFLVAAGRACARLMHHDLARLEDLLKGLNR